MVTVNQPFLDEEKEKQDQEQQQVASGTQAPQLGQGVSSANAGRSGLLSQQKPSSSGRFTDIGKYKQANVQGSERMAGGVAGRIGQEAEGAKSNLGQQQSQFRNLAGLAEQGITQKEQAIKAPEFRQNILNPENFNQSFEQLQSAANVKYEGPQGLANVGQLQAQAENVKGLSDLTKAGTGRAALLNRFYGRPDYTQGQKRLDTALLGGQGSRFQDVRREANVLGQEVGRSAGEAISEARRLQGLAGDVRQTALTEAGQIEQAKREQLAQQGAADINREIARRNAELLNQGGFQAGFDNIQGVSGLGLNLTPEQVAQLNLYRYNTNLDLDRQYSTDELAALADPSNISNLNRIRTLIGQQGLQPSQRVTQGTYNLDTARAEEVQNLYRQYLDQELQKADSSFKNNSTIANNILAYENALNQTPSPGGTRLSAQKRQEYENQVRQLRQTAEQKALQNVLNQLSQGNLFLQG